MDPADFASLLELEPAHATHRSLDYGRKLLDTAQKTNESQASRIKSLEGVLVAIRTLAAKAYSRAEWAGQAKRPISEIEHLITETLDPCKPWCTRDEPGHPGACEPVEDERDA